MKYGQIIKPEDVPSLVRSGELRFGMMLEFSQSFGGPDGHFSQKFIGFNQERDYCFVAFGSPEPGLSKELLSFRQARFPLPALEDGDPIFIREFNSTNGKWIGSVFRSFHSIFGVHHYTDGRNRWTSNMMAYSENWRLPTKKELHDAGLDGWYDGRIELNEE